MAGLYAGPVYVYLPDAGYMKLTDLRRYADFIYPRLTSGDPGKIMDAVYLIEGTAMSECLLPFPPSEGD